MKLPAGTSQYSLQKNRIAALNFYQAVFDSEVRMLQAYENYVPEGVTATPSDLKDWVLHAEMEICGTGFWFTGELSEPLKSGNMVKLAATVPTAKDAQRIFDRLRQDAKITLPPTETFYCSFHAALTDKYGVCWNIVSEEAPGQSSQREAQLEIRPETSKDYEIVERLTYKAFHGMQKPGRGECDEHLLVHKMRSVPAFLPELSHVAELDGCIVGHIAYTKSKVVSEGGTEYETITFGPVSVLPEYQKKGIGTALIRHTLARARSLGYCAVLITGHPEYYPKFGFANAEKFGITLSDGTNM